MVHRPDPKEAELRKRGFRFLTGVDEVGRGPLAGPVVACACLIPSHIFINGIRDSKMLTPAARKKLFWKIISHALVGIGTVGEKIIDRINIFQASLLAMREAVLALPVTPDILLIDGMHPINLPIRQIPVIRGDQKLISIGAASIVAKVVRDEMMNVYDLEYPAYGFRDHKGYPTPQHIAALARYGPTAIHRFTFAPVERAQNPVSVQE